jgi:hypothetical protein
MDKNDRTAFHILVDKIERMARESEVNRKTDAERVNNQTDLVRRLQNENRFYYDALEEHRQALRKLGARGKKMPAVPAFHAELVAQRKRDDDIPF